MSEDNRKMDLWQLVTILIVVLALFGGQYMVNQAIDSRLDSLESTVTGNGDALKTAIDRVLNKLEAMEKAQAARSVEAAAPAAPTETAVAAEPASAEPAAAKPAAAPEPEAKEEQEAE